MTIKLIFGSEKIRLILVYGPQEYSSESDKETFWHNIHVEVERAKLAGENLLLIGNFNAKLGRTFVPGDIHDISTNGNQLLNLWESQKLCLLNIEKFAKGTFTWVNNNNVNEKSVIDYTFSNYDFLPNIVSFEIDEGRKFTPWRQKKKGKTFSDHNAMVIQFKVSRKSHNNVEKRNDHVVWNFNNPTGWKNFHANTEENHSLNKIWLEDVSVQHAYRTWENIKVNRLLHKCFKKKRMVTVLRNRYNRMIRLLLKEEKVLKKSLRTIESNKKRK